MQQSVQYYPPAQKIKTGATLVVHGLNVKPLAMLPLVNWLTSQGSAVHLIQLSGHYSGGVDINEVTISHWQQDMLIGYAAAKQSAVEDAVPLYFLGYSLGALLAQSVLLLSIRKAFDKQVLIAPAMAIRQRSYLIKVLFFFGLQRRIPSYTPKAYRVNASLPLRIYNIMFGEEKKVVQSAFCNINIPTLLLIDPEDELISYRKLVKYKKAFKLDNYKLLLLHAEHKKGGYHHLIIDEATMGKKNWKVTMDEIKAFLFASSEKDAV